MNLLSFAVSTQSDEGEIIKFFPTQWEAEAYARACYSLMGWHFTMLELDKETNTYYEFYEI